MSAVQSDVRRQLRCKDPEDEEAIKKAVCDADQRLLVLRLEACVARSSDRYAPRVQGSASHVFADAAETLVTAFKNNVAAHYEQYLWRLSKALASLQHYDNRDAEARKQATTLSITHMGRYLLDGGAPPTPESVALRGRLCVPGRSAATCTAYDVARRPWLYLRTMVLATRELEALKKADKKDALLGLSLYSPFVLVTSFIPGHLRLHTNSMIQLLGSKRDVEAFKAIYLVEHGVALNVKGLADVGSSFLKATGVPPTSPEQEAMYFTRLWETVCDFDSKKAYKELVGGGTRRLVPGTRPRMSHPRPADVDASEVWRFDNSLTTDGYSVSFSIVRAAQLRKKDRFADSNSAARAKALAKAGGLPPPEFESLSPGTAASLDYLLDARRYKLAGGDPGNGNILAVNDGTRVVSYSLRQRADDKQTARRRKRADTVRMDERGARPVLGTFEGRRRLRCGEEPGIPYGGPSPSTGARGRAVKSKRHRRARCGTFVEERMWTDPSVATYESAVLSGSSRLACNVDDFDEYVMQRVAMEDAGRACYERPVFRNQRFEGYVLERSSEDKFVRRLVDTFCTPPPPAAPEPVPRAQKFDRPHPWMAERAALGDPTMMYLLASLAQNAQLLCPPEGAKELVIIYGNWGRNPNLRGCRPAPGIGFRRRLAHHFRTLTLWEAYTSQVCPRCSCPPSGGHRRSLAEGALAGAQRHCSRKHHLLRCSIGNCNRWWHRAMDPPLGVLAGGPPKGPVRTLLRP